MTRTKSSKFIAILLVVIMVFSLMPVTMLTASATTKTGNTTAFLGGSGTEADPYLISNKTHLNNVRNYLNASFKLMCDIEFTDADFAVGGAFYNSGRGFIPIGSRYNEFTGTFDGNGFAVKKLYINNNDDAGLFSYNSGTIINLGVVDSSISSSTSYDRTGGIVGFNDGQIINCYNTSKIYGKGDVGGIAGYNDSNGTITNCYNTGAVTIDGFDSSVYGGGIVGYNLGFVTNCYNTGKVDADADCDKYGGISWQAAGGGVAGYSSTLSRISNCYNASTEISAEYFGYYDCTYIGNIIGYAKYNNSALSSCYYIWDSSNAVGNGCLTPSWQAELTSEEMKQKDSFEGFSFDVVWDIEPDLDYPYPQLRSNRQYKITDVDVLTQPSNNLYAYGLFPDLTGAKIQVTYLTPNDQTLTKIRTVTNDMLYEFNRNVIGEQSVNVIYCGKTSTNTIDLKGIEKVVTAIKIISAPKKLNYILNQPMNTDGLSVEVECNNMFTYVEDISKMSINFDNTMVGTVPVTVSFQGCSDEFEITVYERKVKSMTITEPTNIYNLQGNDIDLKNGIVHAVFVSDDDYSEDIPMDFSMISGYNKDLVGYQTVTVTYGEKSKSFMIRVIEKKFTSISVVKNPTKLSYHIGDYPDYSGIVVEGSYSDLIFETIEDYSLTGFDTTSAGEKTITIAYGDLYDSFTITVEDHIYTKKYNNLQHWDECVICHNKLNYTEHTYDNTCDTRCNDCDNVRTITHTYTADCDESCNVCGHNRAALINHTYSNGCDTICNRCNTVRMVNGHIYNNACDTTCNECSAIRAVPDHIYTNGCDTTCNECGTIRTVPSHIYSHACDTTCNECGAIRTVPSHIYSHACDTTCNECGYVRKVQHIFENGACNGCGLKQVPVAIRVTATSVTLAPYTGYEYSKNGTTWQKSNVFTGLTVNTTYKFYQRIAETADTYASAPSSACSVTTLPKADCLNKAEKPILVHASNNSISLLKLDGYEYRIGNGEWQTSPNFDNLNWGESYTLYQRIKETSTHKASASSEGLVVRLDMKPSVSFCQGMLSDYIDLYGTTQSNGNKRLKVTVSSTIIYLENTSKGIYCSHYSGSSYGTSLKYSFGFYLTPTSKYVTPSLLVEGYYNSQLISSTTLTASVDRTTYTKSSNIQIDGYADGSNFQRMYNSHMNLLCSAMDVFLLEEISCGIGGVGFLAYGDRNDAGFHCDAALNHQLGNKVLKYSYAATCERQGYTGDYCCSYCGEIIEKGKAISALGGHTYSNACDAGCNRCGLNRDVEHTYSNACDTTCNTCGDTRAASEHIFDNACDEACNVCSYVRKAPHVYDNNKDLICNHCGYERPPYTPGDLDDNSEIDNKDVEHLLWYTLFPESYPLNQDADFDGSGVVDNKDVEYLLWHTLFPESYPL